MQYRRLGKSGLKVSEIALGSWLTYGHAQDLETAKACVARAYELGINHFDCANAYGAEPHRAESFLAEALAPFDRHSYVLTTKAYWPVGPGPNDRGLSRKHLRHEVERSLKALRTDYLDIFYCHRFDPETDLEETWRTLDDLVREGKILYAGISEWSAAQIAEGVALTRRLNLEPITVDQPGYHMFRRHIEQEILPLCRREGIGIVAFSPLAGGLLTGKYRPGQPPPPDSRAAGPVSHFVRITPEHLERVVQLEGVARDVGLTLPQLALAWVLRWPEVASALIGASRPAQIDENVKASGVTLTPEVVARIEAILAEPKPQS
jgi:L-glyceraldehyde 3-phosphate reductase